MKADSFYKPKSKQPPRLLAFGSSSFQPMQACELQSRLKPLPPIINLRYFDGTMKLSSLDFSCSPFVYPAALYLGISPSYLIGQLNIPLVGKVQAAPLKDRNE